MSDHFTQIRFKNYKALKSYRISLSNFNVLVGPNNSGKSTIIGAFRILMEGMRRANARKATYIDHPAIKAWGYQVQLDSLPVATENIFTDYDDIEPAEIEFNLASRNQLKLVFPENNLCYLIPNPIGKSVNTPSTFKRVYDVSIGIIPVLGPVEHNELLYKKEAARLALLSHRASRNFRNIWYHYPDEFTEFRDLVKRTWPGMDIQLPEIDLSYGKPVLHMFCPEERYPREIFWAGFGFQVWCQMLTFIVRSRSSSLLIIDEPDIYLHSDLQRQLLGLLREAESDILIATHSTEILTEVDPGDLLVINKKRNNAMRIKSTSQIQPIFGILGSSLNPTLTQLARTRRAIFVEGNDFSILASFARKLGFSALANKSDFAVVEVQGFNATKVINFSEGVETTLGNKLSKAIIFDRDYRSNQEISTLKEEFKAFSSLSHIHNRKEIENYLLIPEAIEKAIIKRISDRKKRAGSAKAFRDNMHSLMESFYDELKVDIQAQVISKQRIFLKEKNQKLDDSSINKEIIQSFENEWSTYEGKLNLVPGKKILSNLNGYLSENYSISITSNQVISAMDVKNIPEDMIALIEQIEDFRKK